MPVTDVTKDLDARTLTIRAHLPAPVERVWALYADPRQLERVWGPPGCPATFVDHDLRVGERSTYFMSAPDGERYHGYWVITAVDEPHGFSFDDGFAEPDFSPKAGMPVTHNTITLAGAPGGGTDLTAVASYDSAEALRQVLDMGVVEGATAAMNQIDDVLAENP